jgi:hypothetical protein
VTGYPEIWDALAAEFPAGLVRERPAGGQRMVKYITARSAMNRLDDVIGFDFWEDSYKASPGGKDNVLCRLTLTLPDGRKVTKCDVGSPGNTGDDGEDDKGAVSDAFKRACVKFGVGRYLYGEGVFLCRKPAVNEVAPRSESGNGVHSRPDVSKNQHPDPGPGKAVGLDRGPGLAPRTGQELLAWMSRQSRRWDYNIEADVVAWGLSKGLARFVKDWPTAAVNDGYKEACRILRGRRASSEGVPFDTTDGFRIWLESTGSYDAARAFGSEAKYPASTAMWSFDQAVSCFRNLAEDMAETAGRP